MSTDSPLAHAKKCERSPENTNPFISDHPDDTRLNVEWGLSFLESVPFTELDEAADCGLRIILMGMRDALAFEREHRPKRGNLKAIADTGQDQG